MTPTEQEIEFFKEAKRIQELWEPKWGDPIYHKNYGYGIIISTCDASGNYRVEFESAGDLMASVRYLIFLPRQGQLKAMLVEKGYTVCLTGPYMLPKNYQAILAKEDEEAIVEFGSTPSIALGNCLLEVLKEERHG